MAGRPDPGGEDEFAVIARYFAPLAPHPAARGLADDVALLAVDGAIVLTADAIVEGVHFLANDPLDLVARKALRTNLSDLAAKGAEPIGYLLTLFWPVGRPAEEIGRLAAGLGVDQDFYHLALLGGDTVATPGPLSLSVAMLGRPAARTPARAGASPGEDLWVTGAIGDAGLGLRALRGESFADGEDREFLIARYQLPSPRVSFAAAVAAHAGAAMDVSDGLLADAEKLARASSVGIEIEARGVPLSAPAARWALAQPDQLEALAWLAGCGDDYEILLTAPPAAGAALKAAAAAADVRLSRIGRVTAGRGAKLFDAGRPLAPSAAGYVHRLGG